MLKVSINPQYKIPMKLQELTTRLDDIHMYIYQTATRNAHKMSDLLHVTEDNAKDHTF